MGVAWQSKRCLPVFENTESARTHTHTQGGVGREGERERERERGRERERERERERGEGQEIGRQADRHTDTDNVCEKTRRDATLWWRVCPALSFLISSEGNASGYVYVNVCVYIKHCSPPSHAHIFPAGMCM